MVVDNLGRLETVESKVDQASVRATRGTGDGREYSATEEVDSWDVWRRRLMVCPPWKKENLVMSRLVSPLKKYGV